MADTGLLGRKKLFLNLTGMELLRIVSAICVLTATFSFFAYRLDREVLQRHEEGFNELQAQQVRLSKLGLEDYFASLFAEISRTAAYSMDELLEEGAAEGSEEGAGGEAEEDWVETLRRGHPEFLAMYYFRSLSEAPEREWKGPQVEDRIGRIVRGWGAAYWTELQESRGTVFIPPLHVSSELQIFGVMAPVRIYGKPQGVLVLAFDLRPVIDRYVASLRTGAHGASYLLDDSGMVVFDHETEIIGRNVFDGLHAGYPEVEAMDRRMLEGGSGQGAYSFLLKRGGEVARKLVAWDSVQMGGRRLVLASASPDTEVDAVLVAMRTWRTFLGAVGLALFGVCVIFYYRWRTGAELKASHQRLLDIIEFLPDPTFVIDRNHRIIAWNKALEKMTGFTKAEMIGMGEYQYAIPFYGERRPILIDLIGKDEPEIEATYDYVERQGDSLMSEAFLPVVFEGRGAHIWAVASPLLDAEGRIAGAIESVRDITARKNAQKKLRDSEERYVLAVEGSSDGIWDWNVLTDEVYYSPRWKKILGYEDREFPNRISDWVEHIHPEDVERVMVAHQGVINGESEHFEVEYRLRHKEGSYRWILGRGAGLRGEDGQVYRMAGAHTDITERKQNEAINTILFRISNAVSTTRDLQELFQTIHVILEEFIEATSFLIAVIDRGRDRLEFAYLRDEAGDVYEPLSNASDPETRCLTLDIIRSGETQVLKRAEMEKMPHVMGTVPEIWIGIPLKVGGIVIGAMIVQDYWDPFKFSNKDVELLKAVSEQVALAVERKMNEEQLAHQALHDGLTGLPNRALFMERLGRAVFRGSRRKDYKFAALLIDLDRFKIVNDSYGHHMGDGLLKVLSRRLLGVLRNVDTVARLGGDEFAVLLEEVGSPKEVVQVVKRLRKEIEKPIVLEKKTLHVSSSIGIVLRTEGYAQPEDILRDADIAMYQAKGQGKGRFRVFNSKMHQLALRSMNLENELRQAFRRREFFIEYQPVFARGSERLVGFEALARWRSMSRGVVPPGEFIPLLEETGQIVSLGKWVLEESCASIASWASEYPETPLSVSVNVSAKEIATSNLVGRVRRLLEETKLPPSRLVLEITETAIMENPKAALAVLKRLRKLGVRLAIDDFGTGYSSLSYLQQFPVDLLKIDRGFILALGDDLGSREIVSAIIALARSLDIQVVAEGVENEEQLWILSELGCDFVQGYHYSRPLRKSDAELLIDRSIEVAKKTG